MVVYSLNLSSRKRGSERKLFIITYNDGSIVDSRFHVNDDALSTNVLDTFVNPDIRIPRLQYRAL